MGPGIIVSSFVFLFWGWDRTYTGKRWLHEPHSTAINKGDEASAPYGTVSILGITDIFSPVYRNIRQRKGFMVRG